MKPIYFPFTHITEPVAGSIFHLLGPFLVCREIEEFFFQDSVTPNSASYFEFVYPVAEGSDRIAALTKEYFKWGNLHKDEISVLGRFGSAEFYNNEFSANISSRIKKSGGRENNADDPVFMARLFLCLARGFDAREDEILNEIEAADLAGRSLMAELTGNPPDSGPASGFPGNPGPPGDPGEVATQMRLSSFFRLLCQYEQIPRLYVTSSRAVIENLTERFSGMTLLFSLDGVPESGDRLKPGAKTQPKWIRDLLNLASIHGNAADFRNVIPDSPATGSADEHEIKIYAVESCPPANFVSELAGFPCKGGSDADSSGLTLVFLIRGKNADKSRLQRTIENFRKV